MEINKNLVERFISYVKFDTTSNPESKSFPSTNSQLEFGKIIAKECEEIGLSEVKIDEYGYVTATLPSNLDNDNVPVIGFIAHMDTSPDCSGENIKPILHENYNGEDIILENNIIISPKEFSSLLEYKGDTIITANGNTLLGADDKAGIAEILTAMEYLIKNNNIKHGKIKVGFTPDEEIGKGVDYFNVKDFGADFAYTLDGGEIGELQYENFNASKAVACFKGKSVHPGHAKNIMINANLVAMEFASMLPSNETPATTENYEGFFHLHSMKGSVEKTELRYIIRDFDKESFNKRKELFRSLVDKINLKYGNCGLALIYDEYENMSEIIKDKKEIVDLAKRAMEEVGVEPKICPIRGGTDGARLSFMELPCPNIFAGGFNFHGFYEFVPVSSMVKAVEVIVKITELACSNEKV